MLTNASGDERIDIDGDIVGFFQPVPDEYILEHGWPESRIDEVFSYFSNEPMMSVVGIQSVFYLRPDKWTIHKRWWRLVFPCLNFMGTQG